MRESASIACAACVAIATCALHVLAEDDVGTFDPDMEMPGVVTNGVKWIDGRLLPLEGRAPSRPPRNDDTIIVETKVIHMNVPARGAGGKLASRFLDF